MATISRMPALALITDFWNDQLVEHDRQWVFLVLLGLLVSFGFIRLSTRLMRSPRVPWWPGSVVSEGGVHIHHLVFGIVLMMAAGTISFAGFAVSPIYEICALLFGVGMGLTIDEFALWVHLDDVYWAEQGRSSVDAAVLAVVFLGLLLVGVRPIEIAGGSPGIVVAGIIAALIFLWSVVTCFLKGRVMHGAVGFFVQPLAIYAACRIGKPRSTWARRFYGERNQTKQAKSEARFHPGRRTDRVKERFRDLVGGVTEAEYARRLEERSR
jgi:hypothetical protein